MADSGLIYSSKYDALKGLEQIKHSITIMLVLALEPTPAESLVNDRRRINNPHSLAKRKYCD